MRARPSHYNTRYKHDLTPQQERVLRLIAGGRTNAEIADSLGLTIDGVKWHVREILAKLELESREDAAAWWRAYRRPAARASRMLQGFSHAGAWKIGIASVTVAGIGTVAAFALLVVRGGPGADGAEGMPACPAGNLDWRAQVQRHGDVTVYRLSISLRDEQWYDHVLKVVGLGHPVTAPCQLNTNAGFQLFDNGEPVEGANGKPEPPRRVPVNGVTGNPATIPVSVTVDKGRIVPIAEAEFSNWCAGPAKLLIEATMPAIRPGGPPTVSTSLGTGVEDLPPCVDASAPAMFSVRAP